MANYNVSECLTNINYIVSAGTLANGSVIGFSVFEDNKCGVVGEESTDTHEAIFVQNFDSCCECLSAVTDTLNFRFIGCEDSQEYNIEGSNFCSEHGAPLTGRTYQIKFGSDTAFCATFQELSPTGQTNFFYVSGPFTDCIKCASDSPHIPTTYTAGTYNSYICAECIIDGNIVSTPLLDTPHPYYTNAQGDVVIQTQMITLGGPKGLNS